MSKSRKSRKIVTIQDPHYTNMQKGLKTSDMRYCSKKFKGFVVNQIVYFKYSSHGSGSDNTSRLVGPRPLLSRRIRKISHYNGDDCLKMAYENHLQTILPGSTMTLGAFEKMYFDFGYSRRKTTRDGVVIFDLEVVAADSRAEVSAAASRSEPSETMSQEDTAAVGVNTDSRDDDDADSVNFDSSDVIVAAVCVCVCVY